MIIWFTLIAVLGLPPIIKHPGILAALNKAAADLISQLAASGFTATLIEAKVVDLIDAENWSAMGADVKGGYGGGIPVVAFWNRSVRSRWVQSIGAAIWCCGSRGCGRGSSSAFRG